MLFRSACPLCSLYEKHIIINFNNVLNLLNEDNLINTVSDEN